MSRTLNQIDQALLQLEAFVGDPQIYQGYGSTLQEALIRYSDLLYYDLNLFNNSSLIVGYFGQIEPENRLPFERLNVIPRNTFTGGPAFVTLMESPEQYFVGLSNAVIEEITITELLELATEIETNFDNEYETQAELLLIEEPVDGRLYYANAEKVFYRYDEIQDVFVFVNPTIYKITDAPAPTFIKINGEVGRLSLVYQAGFSSLSMLEMAYPNGLSSFFTGPSFVEETSVFLIQDLTPLSDPDPLVAATAIYGDAYAYDGSINEWVKIAHTYPVVRITNNNVQINQGVGFWKKDYLYKLYYIGEAGIGNAFVLYGHDLSEFQEELAKVTQWLGEFPDPLIVDPEYFEDIGRRFGLQLNVNYGTVEPGVGDTPFVRDQIILNPNAAGDPLDSLIAEGLRSKSFLWSKHFRDNGIDGEGIVTIDNATLNLNTITNIVLPNFGSYGALPNWMLITKGIYEAETSDRIETTFNAKFIADVFTPQEYETSTNTELPNGTIYLQLEVTE
jgi:hypothetical protein